MDENLEAIMETIDLYDENKQKTGETLKRGDEMPVGRFALSVHIWIMNSKGEIFVQRRAKQRELYPNLWENPGGASVVGELSEDTFKREFLEELGIFPDTGNAFVIDTIKREKDFVDIWFLKQDFDIQELKLQRKEVYQAKWVSLDKLKVMLEKQLFVPTINERLVPFLKYLSKVNGN